MDFVEFVFWASIFFGGVGRYMGWVRWEEILNFLELIGKSRNGGGQGEGGGPNGNGN